MEIRIGIRNSARELSFESTQDAKEIEAAVAAALESAAKVLKLTDDKGRIYDNDPNGNPLTPTIIASTKHGTSVLNPNGTVTYCYLCRNPGVVSPLC
jgi:hypothetical protein